MTILPSPSIPTVTGEVWRLPADRRVIITARWLVATNSRACSGVTGASSSVFGLVAASTQLAPVGQEFASRRSSAGVAEKGLAAAPTHHVRILALSHGC
jgi:hypothetical protein